MKFVQAPNELGQSCIYLDLEGLELGIRDAMVITNNHTDINLEQISENIEPFKYFRVDTYNVLKPTHSTYNFDQVFGPVNRFLNLLCDDHKRAIAETFLSIHYEIVSQMQYGSNLMANLVDICSDFGMELDRLDLEIDLCGKLEDYVNNAGDINIPLFDEAGSRAQDTPEMTFHRPEIAIFTMFALLNKLLSPILGVFMEHCKKQLDNTLKELHCATMLKPILDRRYYELVTRLKNYIRKIIKPFIKNDMECVVNALTLEMETLKNFASILVRKLVCMDFYKPDGNLMVYIITSIKESTRVPACMTASRCAVKEMEGPTDNSTSNTGEEGNISVLEFGSRCSDKTVEFPIVIEMAAKVLVERTIINEEIELELFESCIKYYNGNIVNITPINMFLLATTYGYGLGGAKAIRALNISEIHKLITLFQFQCFKRGYYDLIPIVSVSSPQHYGMSDTKAIATQFDNHLKTAWNASFEYRNCKAQFNCNVGNIEWDTQIKAIVEYLINNQLMYNLPYHFSTQLQLEEMEAKLYQYPDTIIKQICGYISDITGSVIVGAVA